MENKVFIIQPMNGKPEKEIKSERKKITEKLEKCGYQVIQSFLECDDVPTGVKNIPVYYLGRSIELLSEANYIYLMNGWEYGRGCIIEKSVADKYGIEEVDLL